jgi:two-component system, cell cycle sensor histidine kinase and response regulator CckA
LLVVEDDDAVRRLALRALTAQGYDVRFARDGAEALAVMQQEAAPVELITTDVVMPKMGGRELKEAIDAQFPGSRVLYVSGYTEDVLLRRGIQSDEVALLAKPYTPSSLLESVRRVLGSQLSPAA